MLAHCIVSLGVLMKITLCTEIFTDNTINNASQFATNWTNNCTHNYFTFEEKTFPERSDNILKLHNTFFPPNFHLPYSVIVTYQALLPNGSLYNVTSGCANQQWMWASSPEMFITIPAVLNRNTLLMMNYFHNWDPPHLFLRVPLPCSNVTMEFLLLMTASLLDYSKGQKGPYGNDPRYVRVGCPNKQGKAEFIVKVKERDKTFLFSAFIVGVTCTLIFTLLCIIATSKQKLVTLAEQTKHYSYEGYGLYWGLSATATVFVIYVACMDFRTMYMGIHDIPHRLWPFLCAILVFWILSSLMTATYLAYKYKPVTIPLLVWAPFMILCFCRKKYAKCATFTVNLWINIMFVQGFVGHGLISLLAMLMAPFAILCDITVVILSLFCFTNIFAILFTISAHISTPRHLRPQGSSTAILRAAYLIPLLIAVLCFSSVVAAGGYWINEETKQAAYISSFATFAIPLFITVITIGLKYFVQYWLMGTMTGVNSTTVRGYGSTEEMKPLLSNPKCTGSTLIVTLD